MHEFTHRQIQWARRHDWFAGLIPDGIRVRSVTVKDGLSVVTFATHLFSWSMSDEDSV